MRLFTQAQNPGQFLSHVADNVGRTVHRGGDAVMGSLQRAASATGVNFDYLLRTAQRESSLNPKAKAAGAGGAGSGGAGGVSGGGAARRSTMAGLAPPPPHIRLPNVRHTLKA
jgi:hypothetical protein